MIAGIPGVVSVGRAIYEATKDLRIMPHFVQLILLDVAILSLLPFPGTDGGHLVGVLFTSLRKSPLKNRKSFRIARILGLLYVVVSGCPLCLLSGWRSTPDSSDKTDSRY